MRISGKTESPVGGLRACGLTRAFRLKHVSCCSGLPGAMARACSAVTRNGRPCSLTSANTIVNDRGRSVASPLRRGGHRCLFHARPFASRPVEHQPESLVVLLLDLETTGVDATQDRIVELRRSRMGTALVFRRWSGWTPSSCPRRRLDRLPKSIVYRTAKFSRAHSFQSVGVVSLRSLNAC